MPSIIPGYEYDIFISYRHNDDHSGGVSEFVELLKEELAVTIKEPVTVYFDSNAHDGLLENHSVDKSLKSKLKCLIFIPIISQTYCDPKCYAWQHEFLPFMDTAEKDELGINVKLSNGNVASRVLPIKIHELEEQDKLAFEKELGDVLRAIEFIYKEPGVNRPLKIEDSKSENLNHTDYSNQVNKVANAIKEIITAIKSPTSTKTTLSSKTIKNSSKGEHQRSKTKLFYLIGIPLVLVLAYFWFKFNIQEKPVQIVEVDKSLVVLPFYDMSANKDQEWFSDGLTEELLNRLSRISELKLISRTTAFAFKGKGLTAKAIADSLGVSYVLEGSVRKANNQLRITAQLIKAEDDSHIWSNTYDYGIDSIFAIQEDISENITKAMNILLDEEARNNMLVTGTKNIEAYEEYLKGAAIYSKAHVEGYELLIDANLHFDRAIALDPTFSAAYNKRQDIYTHDLVESKNFESLSALTTEEKYNLMMNDIDAAIKYAESKDVILSYEVDKYILSNNWKKLPALLKQLKERQLSSGWLGIIFNITDPEYIFQQSIIRIEKDPLNDLPVIWACYALIGMNLLDSTITFLDSHTINRKSDLKIKSLVMLRLEKFQQAYELVKQNTIKGTFHNELIDLLAGKSDKSLHEVEMLIDSLGIKIALFNDSPIQIYTALGDYDKADSVASIFDSNRLGHITLIFNYNAYGLHFHLSATPNFSARLREIGIDPVEFEKEHYYQYPVVKLE